MLLLAGAVLFPYISRELYKIQFRNDRCRLPRTNYRLLRNKLCIVDFTHGDKNISFEPARFFAYLCSHPPDQWGIVGCSENNQRLLMGDITRSDVPSGKCTGLLCFIALYILQINVISRTAISIGRNIPTSARACIVSYCIVLSHLLPFISVII